MKWISSFVRFWYDFVVGDDWRVAAGVAVALGATKVGELVDDPVSSFQVMLDPEGNEFCFVT